MSDFKLKLGEMALTMLLPVAQELEAAKLSELLDQLHDHSADDHKATVQSLYPGLKRLSQLADTTKTKIDNAFVDGAISAIEDSAGKYNVELAA